MTSPVGLQGYKGYILFGTVEDINDPEQLHRVKVRIPQHGSKGQTPTDALPWAHTTIPAQGVGPNQGTGGSQGGLSVANNATVMVMVPEDNHEHMTVLGVLPVNATGKSGDHTGASAGGQSSVALGSLKDGVTGGKFQPATDKSKQVLQSSPPSFPQVKGKYPDTHVNVSKSGFRSILHDVGGSTYKAEVHPTGTFTEMQADGNYVTYTTKDRKEAVDGQYTLGSEGNMVITTNGNLQLKVKGNFLIEVEGDNRTYVAGDKTIDTGGNLSTSSKGQLDMIAAQSAKFSSKSVTEINGSGVEINSSAGKSATSSKSQLSQSDIKSGITNGTFAARTNGGK